MAEVPNYRKAGRSRFQSQVNSVQGVERTNFLVCMTSVTIKSTGAFMLFARTLVVTLLIFSKVMLSV